MTPELFAILALGITLIGLLITFRRDARADYQALRADNQALRAEFRADNQALRAEVHADNQALRAEVHADNQRLRQDIQSLAERTARLEGVIQGLIPSRGDPNRRDDAA